MGRKILFITTDQQRYDALGCNGGRVARTPVLDGLAAQGFNYARAHAQSVVCMPARASMITGQYPRTHGVTMNGVPLPGDAPSVAELLHREAGYRTALIGKAHFEPAFDMKHLYRETTIADEADPVPYRGFEHVELNMHGARGPWHYPRWLEAQSPGAADGFYRVMTRDFQVNHQGGGDTEAPQVWHNPVERGLYHTDWVARRVIDWLATLDDGEDWFCWMSFPDPHHPWDPPRDELNRVPWRELDLPAGWPASREAARAVLAQKPGHWLDWYEGRLVSNFEAPPRFVPADLTADQVREINANVHVENELIDEACGSVLAYLAERGWADDTDILYTTDHGELQGDFGLLFKGPYHVDALMRLPMFWRPAPTIDAGSAAIAAPVGQIDLAPTFCMIAGLPVPDWMQGRPLPQSEDLSDGGRADHVLTEWDSDINDIRMHLRSIWRADMLCTIYEPGTVHDGSEGELYDMKEDPLQQRNLWADPARREVRDDLIATLRDSLPPAREPALVREQPV